MNFQYESNRVFLSENEQVIAQVDFSFVDENTVNIHRTFVSEQLRGQGVASAIVEATVNYLKEKNLKIICDCPYVKKWFTKHDEYHQWIKK
ncbi:hypothetical protein FACS189418_2330 [Clostridia bacterium]|nr:hypothetical protein FACS189418_2330 [Clostridia bacterium]